MVKFSLMRDPARIERIGRKLITVWHMKPDWRLCQTISNLHGTGPQDIFYTEDDDLEEVLDKIIENGG
jgi:hypothetical protein